MRSLFIILLVVSVIAAIYWNVSPDTIRESNFGSTDTHSVPVVEEEFKSAKVARIVEKNEPKQEKGRVDMVEISPLLDCLRTSRFEECLAGFDLSLLSAKEIAQLLDDPAISGAAKAKFLAGVMLTLGTWNFASFLDEICGHMDGRELKRFGVFESAMRVLLESDEEWVSWIAEGIPEKEIFSAERSVLIVVILSGIPNMPERLDSILFRGARGELGGSHQQISRAYNLYQSYRCGSSQDGFEFAHAVLASPHLSEDSGYNIAQLSLHYVGRIAGSGDLTGIEVEGFLRVLFDNQWFQLGAAAQFLRDYSSEPYPGLPENVTDSFLLEAQNIMDLNRIR